MITKYPFFVQDKIQRNFEKLQSTVGKYGKLEARLDRSSALKAEEKGYNEGSWGVIFGEARENSGEMRLLQRRKSQRGGLIRIERK